MNPQAFAFDVYGTLVDPLQVSELLERMVGGQARAVAGLWRQKQLEYSFRRGLMGLYEDFSVCTRQALEFALRSEGVDLAPDERNRLYRAYQHLSPYPDVIPALQQLRRREIAAVAFSNGNSTMVGELLDNARVGPYLEAVISVDAVASFKPDPRVYEHLCQTLRLHPEAICLVSSNPFDIIGAKVFGLQSAWLQRSPDAVFDPWGIEPDRVLISLNQLIDAS